MRAFRSRTTLPGLGIAAPAAAAIVTAIAVSGGIVAFERWPADPPDGAARHLVLQASVPQPGSAAVSRPATRARTAPAANAAAVAATPARGVRDGAGPALDPVAPAPSARMPDPDPERARPPGPVPSPPANPAAAPGTILAPAGALVGSTATALTQTLRTAGDGVRQLLDLP